MGVKIIFLVSSFLKKIKLSWRWASVGLVTAIIDYIVFFIFYTKTNSVLFSNFLSGFTSITFNYIAHYNWTFKAKISHTRTGPKFFLNLVFIWFISTILLKVLISSGISPNISKFIPILFFAPISFYSMNKLIFIKKITE